MRGTRLFICGVLVLMLFAPFCLTDVSASENASVWNGKTVTSGWYKDSASTLYIKSAADFAAFIGSGKTFSGKTVELQCDIIWNTGDASEWSLTNKPANAWTALAKFCGIFNGNGHYVSGIYYVTTGSSKAGFFAEIHNAEVHDLAIINSYFCAEQFAGGLAGMARENNSVSGCYVGAYVHTTTEIGQVGGLIAQAYNNIVDGATLTIENCEMSGAVSSDYGGYVGGMVGQAKGSTGGGAARALILNVRNCLVHAPLSGINRVGGMVGKVDYANATFDTCYYSGDIYARSSSNVGGVLGGFGGNGTYNNFMLSIKACYYNGIFWRGGGSDFASFYEIPTRVGGIFGTTDTTSGGIKYQKELYGSVDSSSTYYTDSKNDNSGERSGSMSVFGSHMKTRGFDKTGLYNYFKPDPIKPSGGLSEWLKAATDFTTDIYGNVRITTLSLVHDCADYFGAWLPDGDGQKRGCTYGGCTVTETRGASFSIAGASVRYDDPIGIRFLTKVDKNEFFEQIYKGDGGNYCYSGANIRFGTLIVPKDMLDGELMVDTLGAVNIEAKKIYNMGQYAQTDDTFYYTAILFNFPEKTDTYSRELAVRSYAMYEENGRDVCIYTDTAVTSFYDVSEKLYQTQDRSVKKGLNMGLALGAVSDDFYSKTPDKVQILENASPALFNGYAVSLASQGFTMHTNYEYSGNLFGLYYNDDYVVSFYYTPKTIGNYTEPNREWYAYGSSPTENMADIENKFGVKVDTLENIMRVIVEKRSEAELPATAEENCYVRDGNVTNSIGYIFPNDNYHHYGMGYIVQLADGSFIVIDGGESVVDPRNNGTDTDADLLYKYLCELNPNKSQKPIIAAWILTHRHNDHVDAFKDFASKYKGDVVVEQIIYNFAAGVVAAPTENRKIQEFAELYFPDVKIVTAHTGYKFYIRNAEISILYSIDDLYPFDIAEIFVNNESIVFDMIIDGKQRIMFTGEVFIPGSCALINMYGENLKSDVVQLSHHGHYGATEELYRYIWPASQNYAEADRFVLWPIGNEEQRRNRLSLAENRWIINSLKEDGISDYMSKILSACDLIFESKSVRDVPGIKESNARVVKSGAIGNRKVIELYTKKDSGQDQD